jgi:HEXXH motif-containing protein
MTAELADFTRPETVLANVKTLGSHVKLDHTDWESDFKRGLVATLDRLQKLPTPFNERDPRKPLLVFVNGQPGSMGELIAEFHDPGQHDRVPVAISPEERSIVQDQLARAIAFVREFQKDYGCLVERLLCTIVIGGGVKSVSASLSRQIGTAFINPKRGWSTLDYAEQVLHEAIHEAQYIDQMIQGWYAKSFEDLLASDDLVRSPIRRIPRPVPLVLQAATVAVPIMQLRWWAGAEEAAASMCSNLIEALTGVKRYESLLSERGQRVLADLGREVARSPVLDAMAQVA